MFWLVEQEPGKVISEMHFLVVSILEEKKMCRFLLKRVKTWDNQLIFNYVKFKIKCSYQRSKNLKSIEKFLSDRKPVTLKIYMHKPEHFLVVIMTMNLDFQNHWRYNWLKFLKHLSFFELLTDTRLSRWLSSFRKISFSCL